MWTWFSNILKGYKYFKQSFTCSANEFKKRFIVFSIYEVFSFPWNDFWPFREIVWWLEKLRMTFMSQVYLSNISMVSWNIHDRKSYLEYLLNQMVLLTYYFIKNLPIEQGYLPKKIKSEAKWLFCMKNSLVRNFQYDSLWQISNLTILC